MDLGALWSDVKSDQNVSNMASLTKRTELIGSRVENYKPKKEEWLIVFSLKLWYKLNLRVAPLG